MRISIFKTPMDTTPIGTLELKDFLLDVKGGRWKDQTEKIRLEQNAEVRKLMKKAMNCVTIAGLFRERKQDLLIEHSGFICVDIDNYDERAELVNDPYTYALFKSTSGNGWAVISKINPAKHKQSYNWLADYYFSKYGIVVDPLPKNPASLRFVSYDPDLFINERSLKSKYKEEPKKQSPALPYILPQSKFENLIQQICDRGINIADSYQDYLSIGFALSKEYGEGGRGYFHTIASQSAKYKPSHADKQYDQCLKRNDKIDKPVTMGTVFYLMKQYGIELPANDRKAITKAVLSKSMGKEMVKANLVKDGLKDDEAEAIASYVDQKELDPKQLASNQREFLQALIEWIRINYPVRINLITRMPEINGIEIKKEQMNSVYIDARMFFNSKEITKDLIESIVFSDSTPTYNPIHEFIDINKCNSTGHIDSLIKSIKTSTPNADIFIRKWLIGIIATAYGEPVRLVLSLVGGQNTGKTEWFRRLLPKELQKYYAESRLDAGKDDEILMTQKLIVMDDEMGGKSKQDEKRFKELTSKSVFSLRPPYGKHNEDFKRLAILCGTSNDTQIINDPTGNTRILPIEVISIDHDSYNKIDKKSLFMECVKAYNDGESWQMDKSVLESLSEVSESHQTIDYEMELLQQFFEPGGWEQLTSTEIKQRIENRSSQKIQNLRRFGIALKKFFGDSIIIKKSGNVKRVYKCKEIFDDVTSQPIKNQDFDF